MGPGSKFVEVERTAAYIELYDKDRDLLVRLHADRGKWYNRDKKEWVQWPGSDGHWKK
jgi:hypothetical protein